MPSDQALLGFLLVLVRSAGLMMWAPILGAKAVPHRVRLALAVCLAFIVSQALPIEVPDLEMATLGASLLREIILGAVAGFSVKVLFLALEGAGGAAGVAMGLGFAQDESPMTEAPAGPIAKLFTALGTIAALEFGAIGSAVEWLARSVESSPPGSSLDVIALSEAVVVQALASIVLAVRICFPIMGAVTLGHVTLGMLGRTSPQLNIQSVGFSIAVVAGGVVLFITAPVAARIVIDAVGASFASW